ncbi:Chitinase 2 [Coemansia erecta]|uniref:chitinase n=1 Tax=Coemansia erecta TaxID=147472 RepID=A0A9W7Y060_9FUNG|nr:Chitinase 2 [Coemansia erecta]
MKLFSGVFALLAASAGLSSAFNVNCNSNYVSYYGQNSAGSQKTLGSYCQDATEDLIVLAFMNGFPNILLNFANACETTFPGSSLLHCPTIAQDIKFCQSKGKAVVLSMGGASGAYGFSGDADGAAFADTMWNMFFKGSASQRPFDDAVLDGIDLDIEGGSSSGYAGFINQLRSHYATDPSKQYYIAAAPQCPYPDSYLGSVLNSAWFDMVYVQFYNNYCGLNAYPSWFNYADWDNWAKTKAINKNVKIFIGAPGGPSAASSGYVSGSTLGSIYASVRSQYTSLGGIMTWDVSQSRSSGLASSIRAALDSGGSCGSNPGGGGQTSTHYHYTHNINHISAINNVISIHMPLSGGSGFSKRQNLVAVSKITKPNLRPKPVSAKSNVPTRVEFVVSDLTDNKFATVIKIQTNKDAFSGNWSISFTLPDGQTIDSSSRGSASTSGNTVTIKSDVLRESAKNMAAIFKITGSFKGDYVLPDTSSATFYAV